MSIMDPRAHELDGRHYLERILGADDPVEDGRTCWVYRVNRQVGATLKENGRPVRESTYAEKAKEAERFLKTREGAAANGEPVMPRADRVHYEAAAADPRQHYDATGARVSPSTIAARRA
jgi:hypothetical protein